eukprot:TRINITY_DN4928_c0_g1_i1.p1 TRINITY_DN4928_c0_g1~~TRINITY_DN4928_c0_g1_i1.p1  ORF type:complete len:432 (-),score=29.53 TRINITY_DN4928_c0_g1_i1:204-1499(-)
MFSKDVSAMTDLPSERLTAEYFNFDSSVPPVLVQDASTLFAVAQPLLFYKSSGQGRCRSNAFPGVFLPCGGYGHVPAHEDHALIDFLCKPVPSAELVTAAGEHHSPPSWGQRKTLSPGVGATEQGLGEPAPDEISAAYLYARSCAGHHLQQSPPLTPSGIVDFSSAASTTSATSPHLAPVSLRIDCDVGCESATPQQPGYFVSAVMSECVHIFGSRDNLIRIASNFLSRFSIYDQLVLSALLTECTDYSQRMHLNSDVVTVIFETVKAHIAVREGDNFMLKPRASDIKDSKWSTICVETFSSSMPPLPTPACVYNQFIDTLADDLVGMTREQRLDTLQRQYAVASSLTRLVYPYFDPSCSETTKMQASNEVFYAAGFSATLGYSDPIVRIVSVCRLCATLLGILRNMRAARIGDHPAFIAACEMCFLASSN